MTDTRAKHRARATGNQKLIGLTRGQLVVLVFALLMLAMVIVSVYIGKRI